MNAPVNLAIVRDGFVVLYHQGENNHCPGCGKQQWDVRRATAECAFCGTALPLAHPIDASEQPLESQERN